MASGELPPATVRAVAAALGLAVRGCTRLSGGHSTGNWRLDVDGAAPVVVRRHHPERSVCAVEAALLERVAGTVPVPRVLLADPDGRLDGTPLLVLEHVAGLPATAALRTGSATDVAGVAAAAGRALAAVGTVTFPTGGFLAGGELRIDPMHTDGAGLSAWVRRHLDRATAVPPALRAGWWALVERAAPVLDGRPPAAALVHADYNPKNLLVERAGDGWRVSAVLDWEFAYAGDPLADVGNWLRFAAAHPPAYRDAFVAGFAAAGGTLDRGWESAARALDALAVVDFLARGPAHPYFARAVGLIRAAVERGAL